MAESDRHTPISATGMLPVAPSLAPTLAAAHVPREASVITPRIIVISALAIGVAFVAGIVARVLVTMINFVTNAAFLGRISSEPAAPADHHLGALVILVPVIGGFMARYGSKAIRGHEIVDASNGGAAELRVEQLLKRAPAVVFEDSSLREAADLMVGLSIGRLPVVSKTARNQVIGMLTRSDLLAAHARRLHESARTEPRLKIPFVRIVRV